MEIANQLPSILLLIFLIVLVFRMQTTNKPINTDAIIKALRKSLDEKSHGLANQLIAAIDDVPEENPVSKPTTDGKLLDSLVYYFAQSQTSRAALGALAGEFRNEFVNYDQLAKAVQHSFENRGRQAPPKLAVNKIAMLLQGAGLVELQGEGFRASKLGLQLFDEITKKS